MLRIKGRYLRYQDGIGTAWKTLDRRLIEVRQKDIHFREETVGERRYWDAQVAGTSIEKAISVSQDAAVEQGDVFAIEGVQYEVVQKDRKDTQPVSWLLSLKKAVVEYKAEENATKDKRRRHG